MEPHPRIDSPHPAWWQRRGLLILLALAAAIPLLMPSVPPLVDLPGHMGRYRVQLDLADSAYLREYFSFQWALIGNLGLDLLIIPLAPLLGLEGAVKLIVALIPVLTVAGFLLVAQEIHGRVPGTAFFALPLAYSYPFQFGFVNFALSIAFAFLAFALWLRLGRAGAVRLRAALFVPLGCLIWLCHVFGWGVLGLLAFATETANARERGASYVQAFWRGGLGCLPLAPPALLMLLWRSEPVAGGTGDWFLWPAKGLWLASLLREYHEGWDRSSALLVMALPLTALFWRAIRFSHKLGLATLFLMLAFICLPRILLGSAYADMRLAPYLFAVAILAIGPVGLFKQRYGGWIAAAGLLFFASRLAVTTDVYRHLSAGWDRQLAAIEQLPQGARVLVQAATPCNMVWARPRFEHLGSLAIVRRHAFTNDQWVMPGAQLLRVKRPEDDPFATDPSEIIRPRQCDVGNEGSIPRAVERVRAGGFDYLWLIGVRPRHRPEAPHLQPVWQTAEGVLYAVTGSATSASETPNGSEPRPTT